MGDSKAIAVASDPYVYFPPKEAEERKAKLRAKGVALARPYPPLRLFRRSPAVAASASAVTTASSSGWAVSWPLGGANCAVVRRSAALLGYGGEVTKGEGEGGPAASAASAAASAAAEVEVEVDETVEFPSLKPSAISAAGVASLGAAVLAGSLFPPFKRWLSSKVPQPGQGPTREKMLDAPGGTSSSRRPPLPPPKMTKALLLLLLPPPLLLLFRSEASWGALRTAGTT